MRKEKDVTITAEGRDKGKVFHLTEMSAAQAEAWGFRALNAMAKAGVDVPPGIMDAGLAGFATMGLHALLGAPWDDLQPLLAEMMACVQVVPQPNVRRALIDDDIFEVSTRLRLRDEVLELHTGFSVASILTKYREEADSRREDLNSSDTSTSPKDLEP